MSEETTFAGSGTQVTLCGNDLPRPLMSPEVDQVAAALVAAQGEFEAVSKTAANPFFKSRYADLPSVVAAAAPILASHGLAVTQPLDHDADGDLAWTIVLHKSGQYIGSAMRMRPVKNDPQAQGSAATYARRYGYMALLGLVADEDDDGNAASRSKPQQQQRRQPAPKPPAKPAEPVSKPQDTSGDIGDDSGPVSEDTIKAITAEAKAGKMNKGKVTGLIEEAGAGKGKWIPDLTQDQGNLVLLTIRRINAATDGTTGEDD